MSNFTATEFSDPYITRMIQPPNDPLNFLSNSRAETVSNNLRSANPQTDLIQDLLYEIIRVKDLIKYYEGIPNGAGQLGASILTELVGEAYKSLVDYDTVLMKKYYDLLQNCD